MADELDGIATFIAVAEAKGFRAAGERLGQSHSAVSQSLRRLEQVERDYIGAVLRTVRGNRMQAAAKLGIGAATLYRKLKALGDSAVPS
jgi:DNA-binding NtrC family response regulator